jgi:hypothetical protein
MTNRMTPAHLVGIAALLMALVLGLSRAGYAASAYTLLVSTSPDRSSPAVLEGATLSGDVYLFTEDTSAGVAAVRFWLDNPTMTGTPRKTERNWPHDFNGTASSGLALPFDTERIADGEHVVTAAVDLTSGGTAIVSATFTVSNAGAPPSTTTYTLSASMSGDRSSPVPLKGATLSGDVYVFTEDTSAGVAAVRFWLDDPTMTGTPRKTERNWPHDFNGTANSGLALPFDTERIADGEHVVTAAVDLTSGGTAIVSAAFTVRNAVSPDVPLPPDQVHLAWADDPSTTLTVVWRTRAPSAPSTVEYRPAGTATWRTATGSLRPSGTAGTLHETKLTGLAPATAYEYRVNGDDTSIWSDVFTTRTAPPAGPASFDAIYVADTGIAGRLDGLTTGTRQVVDEIANLNPLLVLPGGDYAYYNTDDRFDTLDEAIDAWFNQMEPIASRSPLMPTYGNHEVLLGEGFGAWADRFPTPPGFDGRRSFSFDVGDVHFISILAVHDVDPIPSATLDWVKQDAQAAKARGQRWIIPYFHASPFADGKNHPSNVALRKQLGPVFEQLGVKLVLSSHDQAYERTFPLTEIGVSNTPTSSSLTCYTPRDGVVFAKISPGGKVSNKNGDFSQFATNPAPAWTAVRNNTMHTFGRLFVSDAGWIRLDVYGVKGDGTPPVILDSFEINAAGCGPELMLEPKSLALAAGSGKSATGTLTLGASDGGSPAFTVTDDVSWLNAASASGTAPTSITVTADASELADGTHSATVTASAPGYRSTSARVTLTVTSSEYRLLLSKTADRSNPVLLDGESASGAIYVFTNPGSGVSRVRFWLDDPAMSRSPRKTELNAPHDFAGTASSGLAKPFDTRTVSDSAHTITAALDLSGGSTIILHGTFMVEN